MTSGCRRGRAVSDERVNGGGVLMAVAAAMVVGGLGWIAVETAVTGDNPTTTEPGDSSRVAFLDRGDCFDAGPTFDEDVDVTVLGCDGSHDSEVVWTDSFDTYGSEGDAAVAEARDEADDECRDRFAAYLADLPAGADVELRPYLGDGSHHVRDHGTDGRSWTVACVAWSAEGRFGG